MAKYFKNVPSSPRKERLRAWLRDNAGQFKRIASETGVNVNWIYMFVKSTPTRNPGVDQVDAVYAYMERQLVQSTKQSRKKAA